MSCFKPCSYTLLLLMHSSDYKCTLCDGKQQVEGYKSCHDSSGYPKSKGSTEDTQEDAKGFQQGHGLKAVAVVSGRLVRHNGAKRGERQRKYLHGKRR